MGEGEDGRGAGRVIVGTVVDAVYAWLPGVFPGDAQVIQMSGEQNGTGAGLGAGEDGDRVPGLCAGREFKGREALLYPGGEWRRERASLNEAVVIAAGDKAECLHLRCGEECGDVFVPGGGATAAQVIVRQKGEVGAEFPLDGWAIGSWGMVREWGTTRRRRDVVDVQTVCRACVGGGKEQSGADKASAPRRSVHWADYSVGAYTLYGASEGAAVAEKMWGGD